MFISYAQNREDVMLWRALEHVSSGFYVDVGAFDPVVDSVSKAFYDRGWRGIHVEPMAAYAAQLRAARPDETVVEKCVGARSGRMTLHVVQDSGLSSLIEEHARRAEAELGFARMEQVVDVITLDELLAPYRDRDIHWLKIDVEGAERDALLGWNSHRDRPWIMLLEATVPNSQLESHQEWEPILTAGGYQHVYFDGLNRFYVAEEHRELMQAFRVPPNVFDKYLPANLVAAIDAQSRLTRELENCRTEAMEMQSSLAHELENCRSALREAENEKASRLLNRAAAFWSRLRPR